MRTATNQGCVRMLRKMRAQRKGLYLKLSRNKESKVFGHVFWLNSLQLSWIREPTVPTVCRHLEWQEPLDWLWVDFLVTVRGEDLQRWRVSDLWLESKRRQRRRIKHSLSVPIFLHSIFNRVNSEENPFYVSRSASTVPEPGFIHGDVTDIEGTIGLEAINRVMSKFT